PGQSLWIPAVCTALALLAMSPRLLFQPTCVSLLFLALTLYLLHRGAARGKAVSVFGRSFSPLWLLPPLFALWVNLDGSFVRGGAFPLGRALGAFGGRGGDGPPRGALAGPGAVGGLGRLPAHPVPAPPFLVAGGAGGPARGRAAGGGLPRRRGGPPRRQSVP